MTTTTNNSNDNQPFERIYFGPVEAAIWQNVGDDNRPYYRFTVARRYRDKDGNWKKTSSFGRDDLPILSKAVDRAHLRILEIQEADYKRAREAEQAVAAEAAQGATR
ncbi:MAG: hypothetical protein H6813_06725 [Phycisphaeraceae bacterium]|nr:hypothetical protein [Phycisphaeraceae bacterium]MCB9848165.1 hypothetical protein [Phycisphaeraceae bacterium]